MLDTIFKIVMLIFMIVWLIEVVCTIICAIIGINKKNEKRKDNKR